ncbi:MAG: pyridoxamine 5'-phosphate oxidase family protein [Phenylobacterium sp.]|uniref:pyridoxamine 5'-phosphate oxidase family protein n=1 Tax=Phenylobacterium sp. TaxID=1871053 RepID=UPI002717F3F0|nr:pyridoxamine 5'-phosphate oxidase family protein [Phenylobacterium sp.]MDO8901565.1 pyridoxamine 5'-phosphate oxidase family protein [Phenylobacterium sp.]MDP2214674.1 pyridoxamine 5'-phosphate oxidase family protein [Phenylobacterium sp.]
MTTDIKDAAAVERRLWDEIEKDQIGMLGVVGGPAHHLQPMTAFVEPSANRLWFFTRNDTDLVRDIGAGHTAMFVFQQRDFRACVGGRLTVRQDRERMDRYWNAVVAAWYPEGKDDPHLTLLSLDCDDAQVWISQAGPMRFAWEIAKANATGHTPDLGARAEVRFN